MTYKSHLSHLASRFSLLKSGFTLIELLVVIAIIGIIMSIGVANLITAQKQARDASRRQIIHNIQTAFEQYYAGEGSYPSDDTAIASAFDNNDRPVDPKNSGAYVIDYSATTANTYCVCAMLEGGNGNSTGSCTFASTGDYYCAKNKQ